MEASNQRLLYTLEHSEQLKLHSINNEILYLPCIRVLTEDGTRKLPTAWDMGLIKGQIRIPGLLSAYYGRHSDSNTPSSVRQCDELLPEIVSGCPAKSASAAKQSEENQVWGQCRHIDSIVQQIEPFIVASRRCLKVIICTLTI